MIMQLDYSFIRKFKSHYDLFHMCDEKPAVVAVWYTCWNMFYGVLKKKNYEKSRKNSL